MTQYNIKTEIENAFDVISNNFLMLKTQHAKTIIKIANVWIKALENGNKVIFCGNGGSAADSQHLAAELMGRYKIDRNPMPAISLTTDTSALTAIGNDYGYEHVFSRPLRGIGTPGDVLVGISTSGNSKNVIEAFKIARLKDIATVAFTGKNGGFMEEIADITLNVPSSITNNIQEMHIACGHMICGLVENHFFGKTK
ncbi:MAG: D-sedoheptulose 7-phosphate isomerase [Alphaproteobacteria bacterium]|nr:D-sedoheptulose 7-phosphate isomerase [Alphaproteobacteria bacterium]